MAACSSAGLSRDPNSDDVLTDVQEVGDTLEPVDVDDRDTADLDVADTPDDGPVGPLCGDGVCDDGESYASCPDDCQKSPSVTCLESACGPALDGCGAAPECAAVYACLTACGTDSCADSCMAEAPFDAVESVLVVLECGLDADCFLDTQTCGDGECGGDETPESCPSDCGPPCGDGACNGEETNASCPVDCAEGCGDGLCSDREDERTCPQDCGEPGCGDGECGVGEDVASCPVDCLPKTCALKCGVFDEQAPCQCDAECEMYGDCCEDKDTACAIPECGDDVCADGESTVSCPKDCPPEVVCGDGECADGESCPGDCDPPTCKDICATYVEGAACQCDNQCIGFGDCCGDYGALCLPPEACGDGECATMEDPKGCPADCGTLAPIDCLKTKCPTLACASDPACIPGLECIAACTDLTCGLVCALSASGKWQTELAVAGSCAETKGCLASPPACGDATCNGDETHESCPDDCPPPAQCGDGTCAESESLETCPEDCTPAPVCGDGTCDEGEDGVCKLDCAKDTCAGYCDTFTDGAPCQCDASCLGYGDCCSDFTALCVPPSTCGDGACETLETPKSCPGDCGALTPFVCLETKCPSTVCIGDIACKPHLECLAACADELCRLKCQLAAPDAVEPVLESLSVCADAQGCYDPPPVDPPPVDPPQPE